MLINAALGITTLFYPSWQGVCRVPYVSRYTAVSNTPEGAPQIKQVTHRQRSTSSSSRELTFQFLRSVVVF